MSLCAIQAQLDTTLKICTEMFLQYGQLKKFTGISPYKQRQCSTAGIFQTDHQLVNFIGLA